MRTWSQTLTSRLRQRALASSREQMWTRNSPDSPTNKRQRTHASGRHCRRKCHKETKAIPNQIAEPTSCILQSGKRDVVGLTSGRAADDAKKARTSLEAQVEISAVEGLRDAKFSESTALNPANTTLRCTLSEDGGGSETVAKTPQLRVCTIK